MDHLADDTVLRLGGFHARWAVMRKILVKAGLEMTEENVAAVMLAAIVNRERDHAPP